MTLPSEILRGCVEAFRPFEELRRSCKSTTIPGSCQGQVDRTMTLQPNDANSGERFMDLANGLHFNVPFPTYLQWPLYSQSTLKEGRKSMAHLRAAREAERVKIPTDDMILGTALHTAFLEPETAADRIAIYRGVARRGSDWLDFKVENIKRIIITANQSEHLAGMVASLRRSPFVQAWLDKIEDVEVSVIGEVDGLRMKGRCDALTSEPLIDLKKVAESSPYKITKAVMDFGYDLQAAIYCELFQRDRFVLVTVEDEPPYDVVPYELAPGFIRAGRRKAKRLIEQVLECEASGVWPGRSNEIVQIERPEWDLEADNILEL